MSALPAAEEITHDPGFAELKRYVVTLTGLSYFASRETDLASRVRRRMAATGSPDCSTYLALTRERKNGEQDALIHELTIGETHFFRFEEQFDALRERVLPELIRKNRDRKQLRVWSAGCSIGPEVYSLAILLDRSFGAELRDWSVSIVGTDIDHEFLERAKAGIYAEWALRGLPDALRRECFTEVESGCQIDRRFQRWTSFVRHNLVQDPLPAPELGLSAFDLVLCRNVMIYFDQPTINRVVAGLQRCLNRDGWLLVGHAEGNAEAFHRLRTQHCRGAVLFQNSPVHASEWGPSLAAEPQTGTPSPAHSASRATPFQALENWRPYAMAELPNAASPQARPTVDKAEAAMDELRALVDRGDWSGAAGRVQALLETQHLNAQLHYYAGLVRAHTGQPVEAEAALRRALFLEPNLPLAYYQLGLLLATRGARTEARRAFRNTLRVLEGMPSEAPLSGSDQTVARLYEAARLQLDRVSHV